MREYFSVCRIDPCSGRDRRGSSASPGPSAADEALVQEQTGSPSQVDPILAAARRFHELQVVTVMHDLQEKRFANGQVRKVPCRWASPKPWKEANLGNCLQEFAKSGRNSIAIVAEESDIYALDVDAKDGGHAALEQMLEEYGPFDGDTPRLTTGNGGFHILFSLSQSEQAGLRNCANRTRIHFKGQAVGIDCRGKGGMLYTAPSSYTGLDGTVRRYEWDNEILPDRSNLRAVPDWLISILNDNGESASRGGDAPRDVGRPSAPYGPPRPTEDPHETSPAAVLERVKACVAATGDISSRFDRLKVDISGPMYVFRVAGPRRCPHGKDHTGSNNFCVLVRGRSLLYVCNSAECQGVRPLPKIGELTHSEAMFEGETRAFHADDVSAINVLNKSFVDYWAFEGDVGGSKIVAAMYASCGRLRFDGESWYYWDGRRFVKDGRSAFFVKGVLINQLRIVYLRVREELNAAIEATADPERADELAERLKRLRTYNNSPEICRTLDLIRMELYDSLFIKQLDADPDVLNVKNGVLLLKTGELDQHRPHYMCSKIAETDYMGIKYPTPRMDAFVADIFNHDPELVDYVRKLYGYAMNGHTREEIFVLLLGAGGNGKGVLKETLAATIGDYFGTMSKDAVVTAPGQRAPSKNAPTNYIFELMGVRLAITDETVESERVDLGLVLGLTGGGTTKARCLYGNNVEFTITHTPFVQTNYPPAISGAGVKDNVLRRLRVVPFPKTYVGADRFDPTNATHRPRDDGLKDRMKEEKSRRQVLSWLARGSTEWYASGNGLGPLPEAVTSATDEYVTEVDKLQLFINQHCQVGEGGSTLQTDFAGLYQRFSSEEISFEKLAQRMKDKGFKRAKNNDEPRRFYYPNIRCTYGV